MKHLMSSSQPLIYPRSKSGRRACLRHSNVVMRASNTSSRQNPSNESINLLEAFFVGRAFAEVVNERLGEFAADILAELGKAEAELRQAQKDFEDEVMARAHFEMRKASGSTTEGMPAEDEGYSNLRSALAGPADIDEAADNLRAEIAAARAALRSLNRSKA